MKSKNQDEEKIDFIVTWVDGTDEKWLEEKKKYKPELDVSDSVIRFRDWDLLKYWFRGVEKFAPWVNHIYFVTYGHFPKFLNTNHPKLKIINHKDYLDEKYLPTYNSNTIEMNFYKIEGLSEHFVYFNDDMFILKNVSKKDFFKNGLPRDEYAESPVIADKTIFPYMLFNNVFLLNGHYDKKKVYKKNITKYFNIRYGFNNFRTVFALPYKKFVGFHNPHIPQAFLKSYYKKTWKLCSNECEITSVNKFRTKEDVTQYLVRGFQQLDGKFKPRKINFGKYFLISNNNEEIVKAIVKQKYKIVCLNDTDDTVNFEKAKSEINVAFEKILPDKCSFEK